MKNIIAILCFAGLAGCTNTKEVQRYSDYPIQSVPLNQVQLTDEFWLPRIEKMQEKTLQYAFDKCETEGRLDNFVIAGKVICGEEGCALGKMPFDDTDVYKTLEGAAYSLISKPDRVLDAYLDSVIAIISQGQEPDGYITTWRTINPNQPTSDWVPGGPRWSSLEISHELYNSGHLFEAAAAHYHATGKRNLLDIALKNADLLLKVFGDPATNMVPGHQIVETGLIKLYEITGKEPYLHLSKKFLDLRGDASKREIWGAENIQDHLPVLEQKDIVGHAVRAVYMAAGMTDIAAIYDDANYKAAILTLWESMVHRKMYITGGIGAHHHDEKFGVDYELPNLTAYSETCAAIGSVFWNDRMFRLTGEARYYDVVERTMYNALIAGISLEGTEYFYPNPLESDGVFKFNKDLSCTREPWFDCSCCPTNLMRFIPYVPNLIYATQGSNLYVNLFMSNNASMQIADKTVHITQITGYPREDNVSIVVSPEQKSVFTMKIRIPRWVWNEPLPGDLYQYVDNSVSGYKIRLNGKEISEEIKDGYVEITREWDTDDRIDLRFPMKVRQVVANEKVEELKGLVALEYGPFVYCAEEIDNKAHFDSIRLDSKYTYLVHPRANMLGGINMIVKNDVNQSTTFIPYYTWSNRGANKMKVWFPGLH